MTAAVFADALDALRALGWALTVWIVLLSLTVGTALYTLAVTVALACRGVAWVTGWAWRAARRGLYARLSHERPAADPEPPGTAERRTEPRPRTRPSWAQTEQDAA